jgi:hypothetical protein
MAYKRSLNQCECFGCMSNAVLEVFNDRNETAGKFCRQHAEHKYRELVYAEGVAQRGYMTEEQDK